MKKSKWILVAGLVINSFFAQAQSVDSIKFFTEEGIIEMTLTTDIAKMQREKGEVVFQPATASLKFPDNTVIAEPVTVAPRGHFRREYCDVPPILIDFKSLTTPLLSPLGKLKLVIGCGSRGNDEQLLIKEYLIYKIYNLLDDKSFRVRLVKVNYVDTRNKVKPYAQYAFLIEDDKDMAARNNCIRKSGAKYQTESTDRDLMTKVGVFEYMISNGDWSVPNNHNIKIIFDKNNEAALPFAVPYDFDHSGFVNASYATPNELLGTESVTERVYRGFPRQMAELQVMMDFYRSKKDAITALINNCTYLLPKIKKEAVDYLNDFYKTISDKRQVQSIFIDNARTK